MSLGAMQKALVEAGLADEPKERHRRKKQFKCRKCGRPMIRLDDTNIMFCSGNTCKNFYIFSK